MPHRLVQITDCHLGENPGDSLLGLDADQSLGWVLEQLAADFPRIDSLICSGDLSNVSRSSVPYQRLNHYLQQYKNQWWLPGNHDNNSFIKAASPNQHFLGDIDLGAWRVTLLDSSIEDDVPGYLEPSEITRALEILETYPQQHHLMFMHHHLLPIGCAWLDQQVIANASDFLRQVQHYPQLKALACGHVHQEKTMQFGHIQLFSTPSTCIQFEPNSKNFAVGHQMPGYRWFELYDDGYFETAVKRIDERPLPIEFQSKGY